MNNRELLRVAAQALPPEFAKAFKLRVVRMFKTQMKRIRVSSGWELAHYDCDKRARWARSYARNHSTKYANETPEQAYDRAYEARAAVYLTCLKELTAVLTNG